jgi:hypothetical protein
MCSDIIQKAQKNRSLVTRNYIGGVMNRVLAPSAVYRGFEPWSVQIYFYSAKHAALRSKSKDWLARNQNNVLKWLNCVIMGSRQIAQIYNLLIL